MSVFERMARNVVKNGQCMACHFHFETLFTYVTTSQKLENMNLTHKKKREKQRRRGKKKQKALAEKDTVGDTSGGAAAQEDQSIDIYLDNDDEVEALD